MNGGSLASSHGSTIGTNGNYVTVGGSLIAHTLAAGGKLDGNGLADWNNSTWINLQRTGYTIDNGAAWSTSPTYGKGKVYSQYVSYNASDFCTADCTIDLYANWKQTTTTTNVNPNAKVKIKLNANGGSLVTGKSDKKYSVTSSGAIKKDGSEIIHEIAYNKSLGENGLIDYNNNGSLYLERQYHLVVSNQEWVRTSDGKTYNQKTAYKASDFCDFNANPNGCEVTLKLNWKTPYYTTDGKGSLDRKSVV